MMLTNRYICLDEAIAIVEKARVSIANGPFQPWAFLQHVGQHLDRWREVEFAEIWTNIRTPDDEVTP